VPHPDPDQNLTAWERTRRALHRSIDRICQAWPQAIEDAHARGYNTVDYNTRHNTTGTTTVEAAALNPDPATIWLDQLTQTGRQLGLNPWNPTRKPVIHQAIQTLILEWPPHAEHTTRTIITLANTAALRWPPPPKPGQTPPANRGGDPVTCPYCGIDAWPGDRKAIKTRAGELEGYAHRTPCWYAITISRGQHPRQQQRLS
jgi:hypothetical protein